MRFLDYNKFNLNLSEPFIRDTSCVINSTDEQPYKNAFSWRLFSMNKKIFLSWDHIYIK